MVGNDSQGTANNSPVNDKGNGVEERKKKKREGGFAKSFMVLGGGTAVSRVLGFLRDFLLAVAVGPGVITDAFIIALRLPNLFRRLFAEGAFNAAFVPQFTDKLENFGRARALHFASKVLAWMAIMMAVFCGVMIFFMPSIVPLLVPGFVEGGEKFNLTVHLARITFPYLFCMVVSAILSGMLNVVGRFSATAFAPVALNVLLIGVLVGIYCGYDWGFLQVGNHSEAAALAVAVLIAGIIQLLWLLWNCYRAELRFVLPWGTDKNGEGEMGLLWRRMLPALVSAAVIQVNLLVGDILASLLGGNAISWLFFADRLVQLPLGIIGVGLAVAVLPRLSGSVARGDSAAVREDLGKALRLGLFLSLPACGGLILLSDELVLGLFGYGRFSDFDIGAVAYALRMGAIGLVAFVVVKVFLAVFFAYGRTSLAAIVSVGVVVMNGVGAYILMGYMGHGGIALAGSLSGIVNMVVLGFLLYRMRWWQLDWGLLYFIGRCLILVGVMFVFLLGFGLLFDLAGYDGVSRFIVLLVWVGLGAMLYLLLGWLWKLHKAV